MSCPTCSATLQTVVAPAEAGLRVAWCARCGTRRVQHLRPDGTVAHSEDEAPRLVERCRRFEANGFGAFTAFAANSEALWKVYGVAEAIHLPEERPA